MDPLRLLERLGHEFSWAKESWELQVWGDPYDYGFGPRLLHGDGSVAWQWLWEYPGIYVPLLLASIWAVGNVLMIFQPYGEDRDLKLMRLWTGAGVLLAGWGLFERLWYGAPAVTLLTVLAGVLPLAAVWTERCPKCRERWLKIDVSVGSKIVSTSKVCPSTTCDYSYHRQSARRARKKPGPYAAITARAMRRSSTSSSSSSSSSYSSGGSSSSSSGSSSYGGGSSGGGGSSYGGGSSGGGGAGRGF